jgi:general stress protein 26
LPLDSAAADRRGQRFRCSKEIFVTDHNDDIERVWALMKKIGFCMLSTRVGDTIRSRPMAAHVVPDEHAVYFLTDAESQKDSEIDRSPNVGLAFADASSQKYVAATGSAVVSNDRAKIKELWSTPAKAWWDNAEDPSIRVIKVDLHDAQYWDSPGTIVSTIKMLAAAVTNHRPDMGPSGKVAL